MVPFVFSILPSRKQQLVLSLLPPPSAPPPLLLLPSFSTPHSMFYPILSQSVPFPVEEAATLQSRSAVPSSPLLSSPLLSPQFVLSKLSCVFLWLPPRLGLFWEGRGEEGRKRRRDDGAERKCLLCKRWSEKQNGKEKRATPSGGRASKRPNGS